MADSVAQCFRGSNAESPKEHPMPCSKCVIVIVLLVSSALAAEKSSAPQLIELAKSNSPGLHDAITATLDARNLKDGTAWIAHGPDFFFATEAPSKPEFPSPCSESQS
jgi:hypothetical protein